MLDGEPIVVIAVGLHSASTNRKTGGMLQTYVMLADVPPHRAHTAGLDVSVCGDCRHRSKASGGAGTCYVNLGQGARSVWEAWRRGAYADYTGDRLGALRVIAAACLAIRFGTYGDPAAAPASLWRGLAAVARGRTGYTHQWGTAWGRMLRGLVMASVDTPAEQLRAERAGWATFRVSALGDPLRLAGEARCPASEEAGRKVTCDACPIACNGERGRITGRVIQAHGSSKRRVTAA
jgi:hypothetical protein